MDELLKAATDKDSFIKVLATVSEESCPYRYNFHLHTRHSDGQCDPINLFQQAIDLKLKGLAITDHHCVGGFWAVCRWLDRAQLSIDQCPHLWTGVEITASLVGDDVHILGFAFEPHHAALEPYLQGDSVQGSSREASVVIDSIQEAGGVAVLAHPARYRRSPEYLIQQAAERGIDGIEAFYCYGRDDPWEPSDPQTSLVKSLGDRFQLLKTCGTDTHGLSIVHRR